MAVYLSSLRGISFGLPICVAITLHNMSAHFCLIWLRLPVFVRVCRAIAQRKSPAPYTCLAHPPMPPTPPRSPEGMAIALPVVYATKDKWQAMRYCVYSGLAEPLAVAVLNVFIASQVSEQTLNVFMAAGALGVRCLNRESAWKG